MHLLSVGAVRVDFISFALDPKVTPLQYRGMSFVQQELLSDLADILVGEGARSDVGEGSPVAEAVLSTAVHLLQWDEHAASDFLQS